MPRTWDITHKRTERDCRREDPLEEDKKLMSQNCTSGREGLKLPFRGNGAGKFKKKKNATLKEGCAEDLLTKEKRATRKVKTNLGTSS